MKRLVIDIYAEMDLDDVGEEFTIDEGEVRCPHTGEVYKGKFIIKNLELITVDNVEREPWKDI